MCTAHIFTHHSINIKCAKKLENIVDKSKKLKKFVDKSKKLKILVKIV